MCACRASRSWKPGPSQSRSPRTYSPTRRERSDGRMPAASTARASAPGGAASIVPREYGSSPRARRSSRAAMIPSRPPPPGAGLAIGQADPRPGRLVQPAHELGVGQEDEGLDERAAGPPPDGLAGQDGRQGPGLLVGEVERIIVNHDLAVGPGPRPGPSVARDPPGAALELDEEQAHLRQDQEVNLVDGAGVRDELEVGPGAEGFLVGEPLSDEVQAPALVLVARMGDRLPVPRHHRRGRPQPSMPSHPFPAWGRQGHRRADGITRARGGPAERDLILAERVSHHRGPSRIGPLSKPSSPTVTSPSICPRATVAATGDGEQPQDSEQRQVVGIDAAMDGIGDDDRHLRRVVMLGGHGPQESGVALRSEPIAAMGGLDTGLGDGPVTARVSPRARAASGGLPVATRRSAMRASRTRDHRPPPAVAVSDGHGGAVTAGAARRRSPRTPPRTTCQRRRKGRAGGTDPSRPPIHPLHMRL